MAAGRAGLSAAHPRCGCTRGLSSPLLAASIPQGIFCMLLLLRGLQRKAGCSWVCCMGVCCIPSSQASLRPPLLPPRVSAARGSTAPLPTSAAVRGAALCVAHHAEAAGDAVWIKPSQHNAWVLLTPSALFAFSNAALHRENVPCLESGREIMQLRGWHN